MLALLRGDRLIMFLLHGETELIQELQILVPLMETQKIAAPMEIFLLQTMSGRIMKIKVLQLKETKKRRMNHIPQILSHVKCVVFS